MRTFTEEEVEEMAMESSEEKGCDNCKHEGKSGIEYPCSACIRNCADKWEPVPKPTNADRIRAMSDEELAMNMMCPNENGLGEIECNQTDDCNCFECILKWLQSEAE